MTETEYLKIKKQTSTAASGVSSDFRTKRRDFKMKAQQEYERLKNDP
jgi:hypothetical protein